MKKFGITLIVIAFSAIAFAQDCTIQMFGKILPWFNQKVINDLIFLKHL